MDLLEERRLRSLVLAAGHGVRLPPLQNVAKLEISMAISKELLEILVCPACKAQVVLKEDGSGLKCVACKRVYPVRDDIPVMLIDQAVIEP